MQCPKCQSDNSRVDGTRRHGVEVERVRVCNDCGHAWRTWEAAGGAQVRRRKPAKPKPGAGRQMNLWEGEA